MSGYCPIPPSPSLFLSYGHLETLLTVPSLYSWANILFLLKGLLNTLQKSSQTSFFSEAGNLFLKKETETEIKQQPSVLEVHL